MKHRFFALLVTLMLPTSFAWGQSTTVSTSKAQTDDENTEIINEGTILGTAPVPVQGLPQETLDIPSQPLSPEEAVRPFEPQAYQGAEHLSLPIAYVHDARLGLELIYKRDYKGAKQHFIGMSGSGGDSAVGVVGQMLIWQALMIENFDFKYDSQYQVSFKDAKRRLEEELQSPGNEAWENFLMGGILGIDAIHTMRKGSYVQALNRGMEAMVAVNRCRELAPDFPDLLLGDGLYNYWRSVVSNNYKLLPAFEDRRAEGIEQMKQAESRAIFISGPATLALAFTYLEERDLSRALTACLRAQKVYPHNVINNQLLGRIYMYKRQYPQAETVFKQIVADAPDNQRTHYNLALVYGRTQRPWDAISEMDIYLGFDLTDDDRATGLYRKGNLLYRQQRYDEAEGLYKEAYALNKHKASQRRLERIEQLRRDGKI